MESVVIPKTHSVKKNSSRMGLARYALSGYIFHNAYLDVMDSI